MSLYGNREIKNNSVIYSQNDRDAKHECELKI